MKFPKITCAICNKLVDEVRVEHYDFMDAKRILVRCHGDWDRMDLDGLTELLSKPEDFQKGVAFTTRRIDEQKKIDELLK